MVFTNISSNSISILDMVDLERKLQDAVIYGQPRTHRPWKKIMIIVEGVYRYDSNLVSYFTLLWSLVSCFFADA